MKKILPIFFTALCLIICMIPSVGMLFAPTDEPIGNERVTPAPSLTNEDGGVNLSFFTQCGEYFDKHFALRSQAITADARIQSGVFATSDINSVVTGTDDWLYYASTLDDYLGRSPLSDAEIRGIVHNLDIIRRYSEARGAQFLFTVAPNKNTLYPEHMPYYYRAADTATYNRDRLNAALSDSGIGYLNLFDVFRSQDEVLYLRRDSHWNNKGALLAYNELMDALGKSHDDYSTAAVTRKKDFVGDLSKMLYPAGYEPEYNDDYGAEERYTYTTDTSSVEDAYIRTACEDATGSLYMYRDSFGNALLPFFAAGYHEALFTKSFPMILDNDFEAAHPDAFIMELVERNLVWMIERPPVLCSPQLSYFKPGEKQNLTITAGAKPCDYAPAYLELSVAVPLDVPDDATVYLAVTAGGSTAAYEAYYHRSEDGAAGYLAYTDAAAYEHTTTLDISVIIQQGTEFTELGTTAVTIGGSYEN